MTRNHTAVPAVRRNAFSPAGRALALILAALIGLTLLAGPFALAEETAEPADETIDRYGFVTPYTSNLRAEPTLTGAVLMSLQSGSRVAVYRKVKGDLAMDTTDWYALRDVVTGTEGYMSAALIQLTDEPLDGPEPEPDDDFEAALEAEGFPESYRPALRALHAKYPTWTFTACHCIDEQGAPMTWKRIMDYETRVGVNMVQAGSPVSQRSYRPGAYDYKTDSWIELDAGFYGASDAITAYYLDPRNFLDEQSIFQFENLGYNSERHRRDGVVNSLKGTFMADGKTVRIVDRKGKTRDMTYPDIFMEAASWSAANPFFLAERAIQEVGVNGSGSTSGTVAGYEGYYNFYNIGAYASGNPVINGLKYAKYGADYKPGLTENERTLYLLPWTNPYLAIVGGARWISEGYIKAGQNTQYFQKFNIDARADYGPFWHQYMGSVIAPTAEAKRVYTVYKNRGVLDAAFEFVIPVIAGMPETPSPYPTDNRSRNNWLKTLTVSAGVLDKAFHPERARYRVTVGADVETITIRATAWHRACTVRNTGTYRLRHGENVIRVEGVSESGLVRSYRLSVFREGEPSDEPPTRPKPTLKGKTLTVRDAYVTNADPAKDRNRAEYLLGDLTAPEGYRLVIRDVNGKNVTQGRIGTGAAIELYYGKDKTPSKTYYLLVYGDADGDGRIDSSDLLFTNYVLLKKTKPSALQKAAIDVSRDGTVDSQDLLMIYYAILRKTAIDPS